MEEIRKFVEVELKRLDDERDALKKPPYEAKQQLALAGVLRATIALKRVERFLNGELGE